MVTAVVEMGTLGAIRVRTKDGFIFFTLFFFSCMNAGKEVNVSQIQQQE